MRVYLRTGAFFVGFFFLYAIGKNNSWNNGRCLTGLFDTNNRWAVISLMKCLQSQEKQYTCTSWYKWVSGWWKWWCWLIRFYRYHVSYLFYVSNRPATCPTHCVLTCNTSAPCTNNVFLKLTSLIRPSFWVITKVTCVEFKKKKIQWKEDLHIAWHSCWSMSAIWWSNVTVTFILCLQRSSIWYYY